MRSDVVRTYRDIHSWVGVCCGLALFIAFYAGALTMFELPLQRWASPPTALPAPPPLTASAALVNATIAEQPAAARAYYVNVVTGPETPARVTWPAGPPRSRDDPGPVIEFGASLAEDGSWTSTRIEAAPVAAFIDRLHQQLGLPLPHGAASFVTGAVALAYGLALIAGFIALLPNLLPDLFALRLGSSLKRLWLDVHNALGVVSLPFHLVMALTVVVFAFHDVFYAAQDAVVYEGRLHQQWAQGRPTRAERAPTAALLEPDLLVNRIVEQAPEFVPTRLEYATDADGRVSTRVLGHDFRHALRGPTFGLATVDPYDGRLLQTDYLPGRQPPYPAIVTNLFALHFGNYGGIAVRWAYFVLGLAGAVLFYTGNLLWIEGRRRLAKRVAPAPTQARSARLLGSLTVGVALGCMAGISASLAATKWLPGRVGDVAAWHEGIYHSVFLGSVAWAFLRGPARGAVELLSLAALATLLVPLTSLVAALAPGLGPWNWGGSTLAIDGVAVVGALLFAWAARRTRRRTLGAPHDSIWATPTAAGHG